MSETPSDPFAASGMKIVEPGDSGYVSPHVEVDVTDLLWRAFLAGFEQSGEGFNGEYVSVRYRGENGVPADAFVQRMRGPFDEWLREHGLSS